MSTFSRSSFSRSSFLLFLCAKTSSWRFFPPCHLLSELVHRDLALLKVLFEHVLVLLVGLDELLVVLMVLLLVPAAAMH